MCLSGSDDYRDWGVTTGLVVVTLAARGTCFRLICYLRYGVVVDIGVGTGI